MEWALVENACISEMLKNSKFVFKKAFLQLYTFLNIVLSQPCQYYMRNLE